MFEADQQYPDFVGEDYFHGFLARHADQLLDDENFAGLQCEGHGRPGVPPNAALMAAAVPEGG